MCFTFVREMVFSGVMTAHLGWNILENGPQPLAFFVRLSRKLSGFSELSGMMCEMGISVVVLSCRVRLSLMVLRTDPFSGWLSAVFSLVGRMVILMASSVSVVGFQFRVNVVLLILFPMR